MHITEQDMAYYDAHRADVHKAMDAFMATWDAAYSWDYDPGDPDASPVYPVRILAFGEVVDYLSVYAVNDIVDCYLTGGDFRAIVI